MSYRLSILPRAQRELERLHSGWVAQHIVHLEDVAPQLWRNGGGQTRELLTWPDGEDWRLRISLADIRNDGPFSAFPGITRWFTVVQGRGVVLRFGSHTETLGAGSAPLRFDGAAAPDCALIDGPTRDLNLMLRGGEGVMQPVRLGQPWDGAFEQRGLFTTVSGILRSEQGAPAPVPAGTLVWQSDADRGALRFDPDADADDPFAWWMGYSPDAASVRGSAGPPEATAPPLEITSPRRPTGRRSRGPARR